LREENLDMTTRIALLWLVSMAGCLSSPWARGQERFVLENVRIFDAEQGLMTGPQDLSIGGGRIEKIGPAEGSAVRIDCSDKFVLPGLCDCHTHLAELSVEGEEHTEEQLRAFARGGVLFVRDVGGPLVTLSRMSRRIATGELLGPDIFFCGPMLEHSPLHWEESNKTMPGFTVAVDSREDVDRILPELVKHGAIMVKTFNNQDPEVYRHLVARARELSLKIVHDPGRPVIHAVPMDQALALGITSFEHAMAPWPSVLKDGLRAERDQLVAERAGEMQIMPFLMRVFSMGLDTISPEKLDELSRMMHEKGAYLCPTLHAIYSMTEEIDEEEPEEDESVRNRRVFLISMEKVCRHLVAELSRRKVRLLVGHDGASPEGIFAEMEHLQAAGVSQAEILRGATLYPARWMGVADRFGTVAEGKEANLLIVDKNPLQEIANVQTTFLVLKKGAVVFQRDGS